MGLTTDHNDGCLYETLPNGQQKCYLILPDGQRKELIRPLRYSYLHLKCGTVTTMARQIAETYASNFGFYSGTYCSHCHAHFPVGEDGEFVWDEDGTKVGT